MQAFGRTGRLVVPTDGDDNLTGGPSDDVLAGGKGNDTLAGGRGNDTYIWTHGSGHDVVDETGRSGGTADRLILEGVTAAQVSFRISGQDVTLIIAPSAKGGDGGSVKLLNLDPRGSSGVETIVLSDAVWTAGQLRAMALLAAATGGDDVIGGFSGNDTMNGGAGND